MRKPTLLLGGTSAWCLAMCSCASMETQPGTEGEPIRFTGGTTIDLEPHDGRLRPAIGVANHQTMRANRAHPEWSDGHGWTYNHASMLVCWNGRFYQEYLSNPVNEHIAPGQTLVTTSTNGRDWTMPIVVFPPYRAPQGTPMPEGAKGYMMHQRMGFFVAPDDRLLVLAFYGHAEDPFGKGGIGRVVREAYRDGSFGPIYFIRYCSHTKWNETNTGYPYYKRSPDAGFVKACDALLANRLMTLQWWDEDQGLDGFYSARIRPDAEALCFLHRKDGKTVGLWKWSLAALSSDEGASFSPAVKLPTIVMDGAKIWGQRTDDGRYALVYNPVRDGEHRYPLAIVTGDDGITFDNMLLVHGEVPPRRFYGRWKDFGPQYIRGIAEGNGNPPGDDLWVTYSVNKEDMWVSRIPIQVRYRVDGPVADNFDALETGGNVTDWNIYDPVWAPVSVAEFPTIANKSLELRDKDPYDYAKAVRVFQEGRSVNVSCRVLARQTDTGVLEIEVLDRYGHRPVRVQFARDGRIKAVNGRKLVDLQSYRSDIWYKLDLTVNAGATGNYSLSIDGTPLLSKASLAEAVETIERLSLRTGPYRDHPTRRTPTEVPEPDLQKADEPVPPAVYCIDDVCASARQ